jgi:formylglycine-generating enzyme
MRDRRRRLLVGFFVAATTSLLLIACRSLIDYDEGTAFSVETSNDAAGDGSSSRPGDGAANGTDSTGVTDPDALADADADDATDTSNLDATPSDAAKVPDAAECLGVDAGALGPARSCDGLAATCGPSANANCCGSLPIPSGSYDRFANGQYTATLSAFALDTYEVTVGRFRGFVAAYRPDIVPPCAGRNPSQPADPGWSSAWNASMPANAAALTQMLKCEASATWTDTPGTVTIETRPINCVNWYLAASFCAWDHGRLPTEAEWTYAASGGLEMRTYPWGNTVPGNDTNLAVYACFWSPGPSCSGAEHIAPVGSVSAGNGRWGHADLAGNLDEWVFDFAAPMSGDCNNCMELKPTGLHWLKGGDFNRGEFALRVRRYESERSQNNHSFYGFRCARSL